MSPDRKTLFILLQSALIQDLDSTSAATIKLTRHNTRLLAYDLRGREPRLTGEYVVQLPLYQDQTTTKKTLLTAAQSELLALNDHQFLVLARDSSVGSTFPATPGSVYRSIDLLDISGATNIAGTAYDTATTPVAPKGVLNSSIKPVTYQKFLDINDNAQLNRFGLHNGAPATATISMRSGRAWPWCRSAIGRHRMTTSCSSAATTTSSRRTAICLANRTATHRGSMSIPWYSSIA